MNVTHKLGAAVVVGTLALGALALGPQAGTSRPADMSNAAMTYEHLANAIIAIRETENSLVRDMMTGALHVAVTHLESAADASGSDRRMHFESAATAITEIATEGDKRVQAVRQRLLKAGHHHHTDADTEADYIFIDGREKKEFLDLAGRVARMDLSASSRDMDAVIRDLRTLFMRAMKPE